MCGVGVLSFVALYFIGLLVYILYRLYVKAYTFALLAMVVHVGCVFYYLEVRRDFCWSRDFGDISWISIFLVYES